MIKSIGMAAQLSPVADVPHDLLFRDRQHGPHVARPRQQFGEGPMKILRKREATHFETLFVGIA